MVINSGVKLQRRRKEIGGIDVKGVNEGIMVVTGETLEAIDGKVVNEGIMVMTDETLEVIDEKVGTAVNLQRGERAAVEEGVAILVANPVTSLESVLRMVVQVGYVVK